MKSTSVKALALLPLELPEASPELLEVLLLEPPELDAPPSPLLPPSAVDASSASSALDVDVVVEHPYMVSNAATRDASAVATTPDVLEARCKGLEER